MSRSRTSRARLVSTVLVALAFALLLTSVGQAHLSSSYYGRKWSRALNVNWAFTPSGAPSLEWRYRVNGGTAQWNAVAEPMRFVHRTPSGSADYSADFDPYVCPPLYQRNGIHRRAYDGRSNTLAATFTCTFAGSTELYSFQIVFDTAELWYTGTGTPASTQHDLWSVAVHEFGHATGFGGHFAQGAFNCDPTQSTYNTMCPYIYTGTTRQRTLQEHDSHTFAGAY